MKTWCANDGIRHRDVDEPSAAAARGAEQRGQDADRRSRRAAQQVRDLQVRQRRRAAALTGAVERARVAEVVDVVAGRAARGPVWP